MASINVRVKRLDFAFWNGGLIGMGGGESRPNILPTKPQEGALSRYQTELYYTMSLHNLHVPSQQNPNTCSVLLFRALLNRFFFIGNFA